MSRALRDFEPSPDFGNGKAALGVAETLKHRQSPFDGGYGILLRLGHGELSGKSSGLRPTGWTGGQTLTETSFRRQSYLERTQTIRLRPAIPDNIQTPFVQEQIPTTSKFQSAPSLHSQLGGFRVQQIVRKSYPISESS